jgi:CheY-like chemotaxis protein
MKTRGTQGELPENDHSALGFSRSNQTRGTNRTILLISGDKQLHENLRSLANSLGRMVVRVESIAGTVAILQATRPAAVLLDLDLPKEAAWETAELLLQEPSCPPVLLLTARIERFDIRTAVHAWSLCNKSESPSRLLEAVDEEVELSEVDQAKRKAIQRVLLGWVNPSK